MIESVDTGELMVEKTVAMVQSALVPMDNVHQLVQEQHNKVLAYKIFLSVPSAAKIKTQKSFATKT